MIDKLEKMLKVAYLKSDFERRRFSWLIEIKMQKTYFPENAAKWQRKVNLLDVYIKFLDEKLNRLKLEL